MRKSQSSLALLAVLVLAACEPPLPDSGPRGAGFDTPEQIAARREAQLRGVNPLQPSATVRPAIDPVISGPAPFPPAGRAPTEAEILANETRAALGRPAIGSTFPAGGPVTRQAAADLDRDNPEISQEQEFGVVAAERDIAADAERLRAARAQFEVVTPRELERPNDAGGNIFAYALNAARPVGTDGAFGRSVIASERRAAARCTQYRTADLAQEAFLANGGPERDRLGLDPDGDGNACGWDPSVVRNLAQR